MKETEITKIALRVKTRPLTGWFPNDPYRPRSPRRAQNSDTSLQLALVAGFCIFLN